MAHVPQQGIGLSERIGSAAPQPFANDEAFGAGLGAAIDQAGQTLHADEVRALRIEKQRQVESDNAKAGLGAAQLRLDLIGFTQKSRDDAPLDGAGHVENVANGADALIEKYLGSISDPRVRERWAVQAANMRSSLIGDEEGWARGRRITSIGTNASEAGRLWDNQLQGDPTPDALQTALDAGDTFWAGADVPKDVRETGLREWKSARSYNYGHGLAEKDPASALAVVESGILDQWITPEQKKALTNEAQTNLRIAAADARRVASTQVAQLHQDVTEFNQALGRGELPDEKVPQGLIARAQALGETQLVDDIQYGYGKLRYSRITDGWTDAEWTEHINPLADKVAAGKASGEEQQELKILQELRPAKEQRIRNDPDGTSAALGIAPPQVDILEPDPGAVAERKKWARSFAATYRNVEPPYLNKDQLGQYRDRASQGSAAELAVATELKQVWGDAAPSIVRQIGGPAAPDMKIMLGLSAPVAQRYGRGAEALSKKAVEIDDGVARQVFGAFSRGVPSDLQPALFDAARKIAAGWMLEKGFTKPPENFEQVFAAALQYAAGRSGNVSDFNAPGGLAELNGRYAWLPSDMTSNQFLSRIARAGPDDWVKAAVDERGNPVKSVPHYIGPDGKPKPYTKGDALRFSKGTLQTLDVGLYHLVDPLGHVAVDEQGRPWTFDIRRLK